MSGSYSTNMSRSSRHTTLPSFKDLLPPHLHEEIDATTVKVPPRTLRTGRPSPSDLETSRKADSLTPSPSIAHPPMPSVAAGFDEFAGRYGESLTPRASPRIQSPLRCNRMSEGQPSSRHGNPPFREEYEANNRRSPDLPPLRTIQSLPDRSFHNSELQTFSNLGPGSTGYSVNIGDNNDGNGPPYSHRHPALYDSPQRGHGTHPPREDRPDRPPKEFLKLDTLAYESTSRQSTYVDPYLVDMDHSPHLISSPHHAGFGVLGDVVESRNKRRRGNLPKPVTDILKQWFHEHLDHPYPSEDDKQMFIARTGLSISQISNWFINARRRQLPALRNQIRSHDHERSTRHQSVSDTEMISSQSSSLSPQ